MVFLSCFLYVTIISVPLHSESGEVIFSCSVVGGLDGRVWVVHRGGKGFSSLLPKSSSLCQLISRIYCWGEYIANIRCRCRVLVMFRD